MAGSFVPLLDYKIEICQLEYLTNMYFSRLFIVLGLVTNVVTILEARLCYIWVMG